MASPALLWVEQYTHCVCSVSSYRACLHAGSPWNVRISGSQQGASEGDCWDPRPPNHMFGGLGPPQVTRVSLLRARARDKGIHIGRGLPDRSSRWRPDPGISGTQGPSRSWDRSWRVLCLLELVRHSSVWFSVLSYTW